MLPVRENDSLQPNASLTLAALQFNMQLLKDVLIFIFIALYCSSAPAITLLDVYKQALMNNPTYLQTIIQNKINHEKVLQARSNLLPTISATFNHSNNQINPTMNYYPCNSYTAQFFQPIININQWYKLKSNAQLASANPLLLEAAKQNLIISVAQAYFNILQDQEVLNFAQINQKVHNKEFEQARLRFDAGLVLSPAVFQAQSAVETANSQVISAKINLLNDVINLQSVAGKNYSNCNFQNPNYLLKENLRALDSLIKTVKNYNPNLLAAQNDINTAKINVKAVQANHLPTINLTGSYNKNYQPNFMIGNNELASVGVQVTVPIFQGGFVSSNVREARDHYQIAIEKFDLLYYQTIVAIQQQYNNVTQGYLQLESDKFAISSAAHAMQNTEESYKIGSNTFMDVLNAEQAVFQAQVNYTQNKYHYLLAILLLKQALGTLNENDLT